VFLLYNSTVFVERLDPPRRRSSDKQAATLWEAVFMPVYRHWSPEQIEAMRKELIEDGATLQQIADREGKSRQRISQLVGPLKRREYDLRAVAAGLRQNKSDTAIASDTGLSRTYVQQLRLSLGIKRSAGRPRKGHKP
jgi:AraC-like DNA-binding protein